ncbi:hypothetical protein LHYA1_G003046 [Lachnellula hyalina]|uniref:Uncharacterized protein n=1 Tax=Lachnellula hyalina TaxID=1316788 RepID=A0A8H8R3I0_9HELO|nr:uncharacterized protein LHYA1_G003046 [Lachnellula hyalina]TVY27872.1 hypothetical protein LHYA1_G003046 [Lachnellula hyalina]
MASIIYLTIEQSYLSSSDPRYCSSRIVGPEQEREPSNRTDAFLRRTYVSKQRISPIPSSSENPLLAFDPGHITFILDPTPPVMLVACLALGCAISSFAYRRQDHDRYQAPLFILAITAATFSGLALDVNSDIIMLGLIPWAVCAAMAASTGLHWFLRSFSDRVRKCSTTVYCCGLGEKVGFGGEEV